MSAFECVSSSGHKRAVRHSACFPPCGVCEWPSAATERLTHRVPRKPAGRPSAVMQVAQMLLSSLRWMTHMWHIVNVIDWLLGVEWKAFKNSNRNEKGRRILITRKPGWLLLSTAASGSLISANRRAELLIMIRDGVTQVSLCIFLTSWGVAVSGFWSSLAKRGIWHAIRERHRTAGFMVCTQSGGNRLFSL